jgi:hypothetical protein
MEQRSVSRETLAAQALGEADPASGGLAPVISPATKTGVLDVTDHEAGTQPFFSPEKR